MTEHVFTVSDVFEIKGRGIVVTGTFDGANVVPVAGDIVEDEHGQWPITAVERFVAFIGKPTCAGEPVGLLLAEAELGDFRSDDRLVLKGAT